MRKILSLFLAAFFILTFSSCDLISEKPDKGVMHVVAIGNNFPVYIDGDEAYFHHVTYKNKTYKLSPLSSCINDANAISLVFEKYAKDTNTKVDINNLAGRYIDDFLDALNNLKTTAKPEDLTVIFISTHGNNMVREKVSYDQESSVDSFFVLQDSEYIESKPIMFSDFLSSLEQIPGTILVLADFCFSGALISQTNYTYNVENYYGSDPITLLFSSKKVNDSSKIFELCSSSYREESYGDFKLSVYTKALLAAIGVSNYTSATKEVEYTSIPTLLNKKIYLSEIYRYIYEKIHEKQSPQMNAGLQDLVIFDFSN